MRFAPILSLGVVTIAILLLAISGGAAGTHVVSAAPDATGQPHGLGDANCSGAVDSSDALPVLKMLAGMAPTDRCFALGDVNCSLASDVGDILGILQYAAGLQSSTTANCPSIGNATMRLLTVDKFGSGTVLKSPSATVCSSECSSTTVSLPGSTAVALMPAADAGSHFDHWAACDSVFQTTCSLLLDADKTIFATFAYDTPSIVSTTKVIDDATMALLLHVDGDTYYFDPSATVIEALQPGDVMVSSAGQGLLRKVVSVMVAPDQIAVVTETAGLDDVIEQGTVLIDQDLAVSQASAVSAAAVQSAAIANPIDVAFDGGVTLTGSYSIHPHLDLAIDFGLVCRCLHEARAILHMDQTAEMTLSATGGISISHEQEIWNQPLAPVTVPVGPVVLVFVPELSLNAGVSLTADAGFETSTSLSTDISAGVEYTHDSGWHGVGDVTRETSFSPPGLTGSVEAKAYLSPEFSLKLAGVVGPTVSLEGFSRLTAQPTDDPWWKLSAGVGADAGFEAEVPVFGKIAEFHATVLEAEWVFAQADGPAPTATYTPTPSPTQPAIPRDEITYVGTDGNVWVADLGSHPQMTKTRLTTDGGNSSPQWSPDGSEIAFIHDSADGQQVEVMSPLGFEKRVLLPPQPGCCLGTSLQPPALMSNVRWSTDGCTLYVHLAPGPVGMHWIHAEPLCEGSAINESFAHFFDNRADGIFVWTVSGGGTGPFLHIGPPDSATYNLPQDDEGPVSWSPNGSLIAFRPLSGNAIRILHDKGEQIDSFPIASPATNSFYDHGLDWSPDGNSIVFDTATGVEELSTGTGTSEFLFSGSQPDWNPNGP